MSILTGGQVIRFEVQTSENMLNRGTDAIGEIESVWSHEGFERSSVGDDLQLAVTKLRGVVTKPYHWATVLGGCPKVQKKRDIKSIGDHLSLNI